MTPVPLRVVIADDHPLFLGGLRAVLRGARGIDLVGEATSGAEAIALVADRIPQVVVMDLHMPGIGGIDATRQICREHPGTAVLILTMVDDDDAVFAAVRAGARGYLLKGADEEDLLRAVRGVADGEAIFGPGIAQRVLTQLAHPPAAPDDPTFSQLTAREREVVELIAQGLGNQAIAARLGLSAKTVMNYVSNIFAKLHVADRAGVIIRARDAGLGRNPASRGGSGQPT